MLLYNCHRWIRFSTNQDFLHCTIWKSRCQLTSCLNHLKFYSFKIDVYCSKVNVRSNTNIQYISNNICQRQFSSYTQKILILLFFIFFVNFTFSTCFLFFKIMKRISKFEKFQIFHTNCTTFSNKMQKTGYKLIR